MGNNNFCCSDEPEQKPKLVAAKLNRSPKPPKAPEKDYRDLVERSKTPQVIPALKSNYKSSEDYFRTPQPIRKGKSQVVRNKRSEEDFQKTASLGKGSFGQVFLVKHRKNSTGSDDEYAMKMIPKSFYKDNLSVHSLILEKRIMSEVKSNFIINLKYSFQNHKHFFLVMEYAPGGDLYSFLHNPEHPGKVQMWKSKGEDAPRFVMGCVVLALETLHTNNIMYRDLKPENILISSDGYAKLADFGLAEMQDEDEFSTDFVGTRIFMAPEIIEDQIYNKTVDLWALGVLFYEMIFLEPPYEQKVILINKFKRRCTRDEKQRKWKEGVPVSRQARSLIQSLLRVDPNKRLGATSFMDIKKHAFFKDFDWEKLSKMEMQSPLKDIAQKFKTVPPKTFVERKESLTDISEHVPEFGYSCSNIESSDDIHPPKCEQVKE